MGFERRWRGWAAVLAASVVVCAPAFTALVTSFLPITYLELIPAIGLAVALRTSVSLTVPSSWIVHR